MTDHAFFEFQPDDYPLTVEIWLADDPYDAQPRWQAEVTGPGALQVPGFGQPTRVRLTTGTGEVYQT